MNPPAPRGGEGGSDFLGGGLSRADRIFSSTDSCESKKKLL